MGSGNGIAWKDASIARPCPKCGKPDWCRLSDNGDWCCCRRIPDGGEEKTDDAGSVFYLHRLTPRPQRLSLPEPRFSMAGGDGSKADLDTLDRVYRALLDELTLTESHAERLGERGFDPSDARRRGYRTLGKARLGAVANLIRKGHEAHLPKVPGFVIREKDGKRYWSLKGYGGIVVPVRDSESRVVALLLRLDAEHEGCRYVWLSSKKHGGAGSGAPTHFPIFDGDKATARVTEGALKADLATALSNVYTIGLSSVSTWRRAVKALRSVGAKTVKVAFDADCRTNRPVAGHLSNLVNLLLAKGFAVELETWKIGDGKGIDDLLASGKQPDVIADADAIRAEVERIVREANEANPPPPNRDTSSVYTARPTIVVDTEQRRVNDEAIAALASEPCLFHRGGTLVRLVREDRSPAEQARERVKRAEGSPRILAVEDPTLLEMMATTTTWMKRGRGDGLVPAHPPGWSVRAVARRGSWPGLRYLEGVVESPTLRHGGTVLDVPGYDPASGLLYEPSAEFPPLPTNPTRDDAVRAADVLLDLVADFPFVGPEHKAAWLAALLTVLGRQAVCGPCPCFLFDAAAAGSGKTLLAKLVGLIDSGREPPASELSTDNEEVRKSITSIAIEGERLVMLDNASGYFGSPALDAALTSTSWRGRILGQSRRTANLPLTTVWMATGNNLKLAGDTHRRVIPCRLEPDVEEPEKREGFRIPDLMAHVLEHRPALVIAGLTILVAHRAAGRPQERLSHFGSFESWSKVIRQAIYWTTTVDPCETRQGIEPTSKGDLGALGAVLAAWVRLPGGDVRPGLTAKGALDLLAPTTEGLKVTRPHPELREALAEWAKDGKDLPDAKTLGARFRANKGRVAGTRKLCGLQDPNSKIVGWWVEGGKR